MPNSNQGLRKAWGFLQRLTGAQKHDGTIMDDTVEGMLKMLRRLIGEDIDLLWQPGQTFDRSRSILRRSTNSSPTLCVNARDAIAGVGKISIETASVTFDEAYCTAHLGFVPGEYILLAVSDNGCGMDQETLKISD